MGKTLGKVSASRTRLLETSARKVSRLSGHRMESTRREGKYCFLQAGGEEWLVLHFGMTGSVSLYDNRGKPPEYTVLSMELKEGGAHLAILSKRKLGKIDVTGSPDEFLEENEIGRDALKCSEKEFVEILGSKRGSIKSALMNQSSLSGIGNIYGDEILFQARVHPQKRIDRLQEKDLKDLYQTVQEVLDTAIESEADPGKMPESYLIRHRGKDEKCPSCNGPVKKIKVSGRAGYYCPECQKKE